MNSENIFQYIEEEDETITKVVYKFKVIIIGDINSGKTTIIKKLLKNKFNSSNSTTNNSTINNYTNNTTSNINYSNQSTQKNIKLPLEEISNIKNIYINNSTIASMCIWDTFGEEKYNSISKQIYKDAHGILIIFDLNNNESFKNIKNWLNEVKNNCPLNSIVYIIGNKKDLKRNVNVNDINDLIIKEKIVYFEISAINDDYICFIEKIFRRLGKEIIDKFQNDFNNLSDNESQKNSNRNFNKKISLSKNSLKLSNIKLESSENKLNNKNYCC
jgi:small GTP-binding protein